MKRYNQLIKEGYSEDTDKWFDSLADESEKFFGGKKDPHFEKLVAFVKGFEEGKIKATELSLDKLKKIVEGLPSGSEYKAFKEFILPLNKSTYSREFKHWNTGQVFVIKSVFDLIRQAVLYHEVQAE